MSQSTFIPFQNYLNDINKCQDGRSQVFPSKYITCSFVSQIDSLTVLKQKITDFNTQLKNTINELKNDNKTDQELYTAIKKQSWQFVHTLVNSQKSITLGDINFLSHELVGGDMYSDIYLLVDKNNKQTSFTLAELPADDLLEKSLGYDNNIPAFRELQDNLLRFGCLVLYYNLYAYNSKEAVLKPVCIEIPAGVVVLNTNIDVDFTDSSIAQTGNSWGARICSRILNTELNTDVNVVVDPQSIHEYKTLGAVITEFGKIATEIQGLLKHRDNITPETLRLVPADIKAYLEDFKNQSAVNVPYVKDGYWFLNGKKLDKLIDKSVLEKIVHDNLENILKNTNDPKFRGPRGDRGDKGEKGEKGDIGLRGERGEKGEKGAKGDRGEKGEQGIQGERGEKGSPGRDGVDGKNGVDGINGKDGLNGAKGDKGERGEKGPKGDRGEKGDQGIQGVPGTNGTNGKDGTQIDIYGISPSVIQTINGGGYDWHPLAKNVSYPSPLASAEIFFTSNNYKVDLNNPYLWKYNQQTKNWSLIKHYFREYNSTYIKSEIKYLDNSIVCNTDAVWFAHANGYVKGNPSVHSELSEKQALYTYGAYLMNSEVYASSRNTSSWKDIVLYLRGDHGKSAVDTESYFRNQVLNKIFGVTTGGFDWGRVANNKNKFAFPIKINFMNGCINIFYIHVIEWATQDATGYKYPYKYHLYGNCEFFTHPVPLAGFLTSYQITGSIWLDKSSGGLGIYIGYSLSSSLNHRSYLYKRNMPLGLPNNVISEARIIEHELDVSFSGF